MTISVCMIVKNEEKVLARCLDSLQAVADEIIIVDTGSTDRTKEIAARYTGEKDLWDYAWEDDFSKARNFAFSKCSGDYIYSADADEVLDEENQKRFLLLKKALIPEVEIVQMKYVEEKTAGILNAQKEYRPKLFKRQRSFVWMDAIHETVRLDPVVFDSDIEIQHLPEKRHTKRDFKIFERQFAREKTLSERIQKMYAKELLKEGDTDDMVRAAAIFEKLLEEEKDNEAYIAAALIIMRAARLRGDGNTFLKYALKNIALQPSAEAAMELGSYFFEEKDYEEAVLWYYNAAYEMECLLDIHAGGDLPRYALSKCYAMKKDNEMAEKYQKEAENWEIPEEQV